MDQALAQLEQVDFEVVYHAYVIDHKTDPGGEQYLAYNRRRWGGDGWCVGRLPLACAGALHAVLLVPPASDTAVAPVGCTEAPACAVPAVSHPRLLAGRTGDLRRSGSPDGATFADWVWWPSSLKGGVLLGGLPTRLALPCHYRLTSTY